MKILDDLRYIGVNDHSIDLFEGHFIVPEGMAYNSYAIIDEKTVIMDPVEKGFAGEWLENVERELEGRTPDYLVVSHMEPDHSSSITAFMDKFPNASIVSSAKAFDMMKNFYGNDYADRRVVVGEGDELKLGKHTLSFLTAPMVHWPEVIFTYDRESGTLFSADAFGRFGALDVEQDWACEARRYYFGIVGKYGAQVKAVLAKVKNLDVKRICALHGPVLDNDLPYYLGLYETWAGYGVESEGVTIAYTSVYGNTKAAVELLEQELIKRGCPKVAVSDLARSDMAEVVEDAFRYGKIVLATTTYNAGIFPYMRQFIDELAERGFKNRKVGLIENGSWAPTAAKVMMKKLEECKDLTFAEPVVTIRSAMTDETKQAIAKLAESILA